jgi:hypothetical protein
MKRTLLLGVAVSFFGCATVPKGDVDELKPSIEAFHKCARWKDFQCVANMLVPTKKDAFLKAREKLIDERDLSITDYELEEAKVAPDRLKASAVSHIKWFRLPSNKEENSTVTSNWVWLDSAWRLDSQDGGPFATDLKL